MKELSDQPTILYHYTNREGYEGILTPEVKLIKPSRREPQRKKHIVGQYFTDVPPENILILPKSEWESISEGCFTVEQFSLEILGSSRLLSKLHYYIKIDLFGLEIYWCGAACSSDKHIYVHVSDTNLDISKRIISHGERLTP
jgi:hypothetical protein